MSIIIIIGLSHRVPLSTKGNIGNFGEQTWLSQFLSSWIRIWIWNLGDDYGLKYVNKLDLANKHCSALNKKLKLNELFILTEFKWYNSKNKTTFATWKKSKKMLSLNGKTLKVFASNKLLFSRLTHEWNVKGFYFYHVI